jgi:hypothetical protein
MTTELDPLRWTESSHEAPELLRASFAAATREGPSAAQMRMLAVKLAAVAAGTAVVTAASSAQASTSASSTLTGGAAAGTALPLAKIAAAVAVVGASALGGVAWFHEPALPSGNASAARDTETTISASAPLSDARQDLPKGTTMRPVEVRADASIDARKRAPDPTVRDADAQARSTDRVRAVTGLDATTAQRATQARPSKSNAARTSTAARSPQEVHPLPEKADVPSEVELLRRARTALAARPREAFALTEQHRDHYPRGVFAQERDALAIEALLRAGDTDTARNLAQRFVRAHPSSPHAHRFRETLGLR